jgi:hypothetical protein
MSDECIHTNLIISTSLQIFEGTCLFYARSRSQIQDLKFPTPEHRIPISRWNLFEY